MDRKSLELFDAWMASLRARAVARKTLTAYRWTVTTFLHWTEDEHLTLEQIDHGHVAAWIASRDVGARSRYAYTSNLSTFFAWCEREEHLPSNPVTRVTRPRLGKYLPRPAGTAQIHAALDECDPRVGAMIACGAYAGMRVHEIAKLHTDDLLLERCPPVVLVHGKGNKERLVPVHQELLAALKRHGITHAGWVFPSPSGRHLSTGYVGKLIGEAFDKGIVPHQLRHWCGTESYRASHDILAVQAILGHGSVATTQIYTKLDQERAGEVIGGLPTRPLRAAPPAA